MVYRESQDQYPVIPKQQQQKNWSVSNFCGICKKWDEITNESYTSRMKGNF